MAQDHSIKATASSLGEELEGAAAWPPAGAAEAATVVSGLPPPLTPAQFSSLAGPPPLPSAPRSKRAAPPAPPSLARDIEPATDDDDLAPPPRGPGLVPKSGDDIPTSDRRTARRRAAAPSRDRIAANDDAPSIGGLIYALNQRPSKRPFGIAAGVSAGWAAVTLGFAAFWWSGEIAGGASMASLLARPEMLMLVATLLGPIGLFFAFAMMAWRSEELRLRSSAMTEVAVRLAEPDRMAEQSVASLGQAVRRQVSFMNDAVARALGRAGELEALVHNEVSALERSYEENERKIRSLIQELAGEREALVNTSDRVSGTLSHLGTEVPQLIEKLSTQQIKLAQIIEGAGQNLSALESAIATQTGNLETTLGNRTQHLESVLGEYTHALSSSLDTRMEQIGTTIASRTGDLQVVFEEYTRALDSTLATRADAIDDAFQDRLRLFDESILRSTMAIDSSIGEKANALTSALDYHAQTLGDTLSRQSVELDESLLQGITAVRRTSENITRQSIKAIEGLASQSDLLKNVSENLLGQINSVTNRFENQGQQILRAANALESANHKIDQTLQARHGELSDTLDRISGKADELGSVAHGYSRQIEGSIGDAERRARSLTAELAQSTEERSRSTLADIERMRSAASDNTTRALEDLRSRFSNVTQEVTQSLGTLSNQFTETTGDVRQRAAQASQELAGEQERLRAQIQSLPNTTRESAEQMRKMLQDQLRALDQLSTLTQREASTRDVSRPVAPLSQAAPRPLVQVATSPATREEKVHAISTLSSVLSHELQARAQRQPAPAPAAPPTEAREGWSLGDLLKRASLDDGPAGPEPHPQPYQQQQPQQQYAPSSAIDFAAAARALDPATASAIWQRLGAGQTGIMVRSIYSPDGRALFDQTVHRLQTDGGMQQTTHQYLTDFERVLQEAEHQDPSGRTAQGHLTSDYGRVYLFLAHASGRIT